MVKFWSGKGRQNTNDKSIKLIMRLKQFSDYPQPFAEPFNHSKTIKFFRTVHAFTLSMYFVHIYRVLYLKFVQSHFVYIEMYIICSDVPADRILNSLTLS